MLVDVVVAALEGDGGGEEDVVGVGGEGVDEVFGGGGGEMLADFEADGEVEAAAQGKGFFEVELEDEVGGYDDGGFVEPGAFDAADVGDAEVGGGLEPGAQTAADVEDGAGVEVAEEREDVGGGVAVGEFSCWAIWCLWRSE